LFDIFECDLAFPVNKGSNSHCSAILKDLESIQGTLTQKGRLSTVDLLIKVASLVKKVNNIFNIEMSLLNASTTEKIIY
jgi:hypothetical protein